MIFKGDHIDMICNLVYFNHISYIKYFLGIIFIATVLDVFLCLLSIIIERVAPIAMSLFLLDVLFTFAQYNQLYNFNIVIS